MLIIYAHPNKDGHTGKILKEVDKYLKSKKQSYVLVDLYKMKYDPVLHDEEHYTSGGKRVSAQTKKIQSLIKEHKKIIFIYPTWWGGMPAILKGMCDKVFTSGFGFKYINRIPRGLLNNEALIFTTTGGPAFFNLIVRNPSIKALKNYVLSFCGISSEYCIIANCTKYTEEKGKEIEKKVLNCMEDFNE